MQESQNARIAKCTAAFNTKIINLWIKVCSEKADRTYRFFSKSCCFFTDLSRELDRNYRQKSGPATDPHVNIYFLKAGTDNAARISSPPLMT